jgi:hypothetical protein
LTSDAAYEKGGRTLESPSCGGRLLWCGWREFSLARSRCVLSIFSLSTNYRCPYATSAIFIVLASDSGGQIAIDRDSVTGIEHRDWGSNERTC